MRWWDVGPIVPLEVELFGAEAWTAETWWAELAQPGRHYVVAEAAPGQVAGYAGVLVNGVDADVMTIAVAPAGQDRGLGTTLLQALLDLAATHGVEQVLLEVRADNVAARRLYERAGFKRIAVRRGYYRSADGSVDAWVMRRREPDSLPR
jgi:[ribosomal protein S18]-alanine N-acetyltransferase